MLKTAQNSRAGFHPPLFIRSFYGKLEITGFKPMRILPKWGGIFYYLIAQTSRCTQ